MEEGSVMARAGNRKASGSRSLVAEIEMDKMPEHCGGANEKLMEVTVSGATKIMEKGSCSSWVVEMDKICEDAKASVEMARWNRHSIYRVPQFIKDMTNSEAYSPRFVSLGPFHHGEAHLQPMEEHKRRAMAHMVNRSGKPAQEFVAAIDEVADELQAAYNDLDDDKWRGANKDRFVEMMIMDGCFLLEWARTLERFGIYRRRNFAVDYATNDPVFSVGSYIVLWPMIRRDMIAMENQLPLLILQRLLAVQSGKFPKAREINTMVLCLLDVPCFDKGMDELGLHFMDIFHKSYCGTAPPRLGGSRYDPCTSRAVKLSEAGIQFRKSMTQNVNGVDFFQRDGVLSMPLFEVNDDTEAELLNLMAFEWLHPAYANFYVASYISFMDKIIESERDAALLRSQGIFENMMGSDKKVLEMFNTLTKLARTPGQGSKLGGVIWYVNRHIKHVKDHHSDWKDRRKKWGDIFMDTYLSNPWVIASTLAALLLLVATLMQTVYTVVPFYTRKG